jgi:ketosteroid isomerase-like protein
MKIFIRVVLFLACVSFLRAADLAALKAELIKADTDFCALAAKDGASAAFLANIDQNGSLLVFGQDFHGAAAVKELYADFPKEAVLRWKPLLAEVATSGDLGYTTGTYELSLPGANGAAPRARTGKYVTIWKRQSDGTWKFVLDGGNPDPPKKSEG